MKIEKKLDSWLWFIIRIFPFLYVLFCCIAYSGSLGGGTFTELAIDYEELFTGVVQGITFMPVFTILLQIFVNIGITTEVPIIGGMLAFASYIVFVELLRFLYIFFTFIFKLMRNWIEGWV